jgi:hypothetical protein
MILERLFGRVNHIDIYESLERIDDYLQILSGERGVREFRETGVCNAV